MCHTVAICLSFLSACSRLLILKLLYPIFCPHLFLLMEHHCNLILPSERKPLQFNDIEVVIINNSKNIFFLSSLMNSEIFGWFMFRWKMLTFSKCPPFPQKLGLRFVWKESTLSNLTQRRRKNVPNLEQPAIQNLWSIWGHIFLSTFEPNFWIKILLKVHANVKGAREFLKLILYIQKSKKLTVFEPKIRWILSYFTSFIKKSSIPSSPVCCQR